MVHISQLKPSPTAYLVELVKVLHVAEEDVPDDRDGVDVGHAVLGRHVDEVDVLRRRPDAPVKLNLRNTLL